MNAKSDIAPVVSGIFKENRLAIGDGLCVAGVSGGVDSMVMLHVLAIQLKYRVVVAHVNYCKRGAQSDADEELVREFCSRHDIPIEVYDLREIPRDVLESDKDNRPEHTAAQISSQNQNNDSISGNFQDYAREVRMRFYRSVMQKRNAGVVCLAHHKDDQLETIFQKILRGAAVEYWKGMQTVDMPWVRPLLSFTRNDLLAYVEKHKVPYRTDTSNLESDYARNMLRNQVFPLFDDHLPGWRENLMQVSQFGRLHQKLLDHITSQITEYGKPPGMSSRELPGMLNRDRWLLLPEKVRIAVARHWIRRQTGFTGWRRGAVERLADLEHIQTGARIPVLEHCDIYRDRNHFVIYAGQEKMQEDSSVVIPLNIGTLSGISLQIADCIFSVDYYRPDMKSGGLQLNIECLPEELLVRTWRQGDRIQPLGMKGDQTVADHLTNRKISSSRKKATLVLVSFDGIVYAVIFPHSLGSGEIGTIAEHVRCQTAGQQVLLIKKPEISS